MSTALSQNGMSKDRMIDLNLESTGTNTDSGKWLMSSKGSGVEIDSGSGSKSRSWNSSPHSFSYNGMWLILVIQVQKWQVWESKLILKYYSSRVIKQESISIQEFELNHRFENLGHISNWVQCHKNKNLPICQWDFQNYKIGQVQHDDHQRWVIQFHDELAQDPMLTREKDWNQVKTPES